MSVMSYRPPRRGNLVGLIALGLVILGALAVAAFVFLPVPVRIAGVPVLPYAAGALLLAAFVLSIIGLTRWGQPKATSMVALILSVVIAGGGVAGPSLLSQSAETKFLATVRAKVHTNFSDNELLALGTTMCETLREGGGGQAFQEIIRTAGLAPYDLGVVGGAATRHICPDQNEAARKLFAPTEGD